MKKTVLLLFVIFFITLSFASTLGNGKWYTIDSKHFHCIYYQKDYNIALKVLGVAEDALTKISSSLGYKYTFNNFKIPIVLVDYLDLTNGSANPVNDAITIYLYHKDIIFFGGNLPWLRRVISHELTHIITFLLMKIDIADFMNPFPSPKFSVPDWFLEGTARYFGEQWDYSKQALITNAALNGTLLPYDKLSDLHNTSMINSNLVYEEGHSIVSYIVSTHSSTAVGSIYKRIGEGVDFYSAFKDVLKKSPQQFYQEWKTYEYKEIAKYIKNYTSVKGVYDKDFNTVLQDKSSLKFSPLFFDNSRYEIEVYSYDSDTGALDLVFMDRKTGKKTVVDSFVGEYFDFSNDVIYYTKLVYYNNGFYSDLFSYNIKTKVKKRLTYGQRVRSPAIIGKKVFLIKFDKLKNILVYFDLKNNKISLFDKLTTFYNLDYIKYNENLNTLLFENYENKRSVIGVYDFSSGKTKIIVDDPYYKTNPKWFRNLVIFISNKSGLPQLFISTLNGEVIRITNFNTGVFDASYNNDIFYLSIMDKDTFKIVKVKKLDKIYTGSKDVPSPTLNIAEKSVNSKTEKPYNFWENLSYVYLNFNYDIGVGSNLEPSLSGMAQIYLSDTLKTQSIIAKIPIYSDSSNPPWGLSYSNNITYPNYSLSLSHSINAYTSFDLNTSFPFYTDINSYNNLSVAFSFNKFDGVNHFFSSQSLQYVKSSFSPYSFNYFDPKNGYLFSAVENLLISDLFSPALRLGYLSYLAIPTKLFHNGSFEMNFYAIHNFGNDNFNYVATSFLDPFLGIVVPIPSQVYLYLASTYLNLQFSIDSLFIENNMSLSTFGRIEGNFNLNNDWYKNFNFSIGEKLKLGIPQNGTSIVLSGAYNFNSKSFDIRINVKGE